MTTYQSQATHKNARHQPCDYNMLLGSWNDVVFNGIMLVVGTIVGAIWGRQNT